MTEEEIRPIAEQYVEEYCHCSDGEYTDGSLICAGIGTALIVARRLEKKNAELRITTVALENANKAMSKELDDMTSGGISVLKNVVRSKEQLTQAKFLLKQLVDAFPKSYSDVVKDTLDEARKFVEE